MPLIYKSQNDKSNLGVWRIDEPISFFLDKLNLNDYPGEKLNDRKLEKLGTRHLLNLLADKPIHEKIQYDGYGKPYLDEMNDFISFSHKKSHVAVIISNQNKLTGIDIEKIGALPVKLSAKFVSQEDFMPDSLFSQEQKCTLIWSAKETIYKCYGKKELDFRQNLKVCFDKENHLTGFINKGDYSKQIPLKYEFIEDFALVYTH
ncbi:MAG: 4'-phosphopantetheinyl transferase superfamily protein [Bacteroidetes bacterium]|nr:4'-phosphopantetheinyl transferase superfamily protein [Bacteroidota bacterium]